MTKYPVELQASSASVLSDPQEAGVDRSRLPEAASLNNAQCNWGISSDLAVRFDINVFGDRLES